MPQGQLGKSHVVEHLYSGIDTDCWVRGLLRRALIIWVFLVLRSLVLLLLDLGGTNYPCLFGTWECPRMKDFGAKFQILWDKNRIVSHTPILPPSPPLPSPATDLVASVTTAGTTFENSALLRVSFILQCWEAYLGFDDHLGSTVQQLLKPGGEGMSLLTHSITHALDRIPYHNSKPF